MHFTLLSSLALISLALACGDSDNKTPVATPDSSTDADADTSADASKPQRDASTLPRDCDKLDTPGNDCADAVGCREAPECGLDTSSCCVPGFDVDNVKCIDGLTCGEGISRASCDGPEDCAGRACCVDIVMGTAACVANCGTNPALCHTDADCPSPKVCIPGGSFTWWGVCN